MIELLRWCHGPAGTFGTLRLGDWQCYTVERPWAGNAEGESCIPAGVYTLRLRRSPVVERTSGGRYREGWQVCDVPGRTYIMLHPANTAQDVEGCIGVGEALGYVYGQWAVTSSRSTFEVLMRELAVRTQWQIDIRPYVPEWP